MEQDYRLAEGEYRFACLVWPTSRWAAASW